MGKDKYNDIATVFEGKPLGQCLTETGHIIQRDVIEVQDFEKIDWTNVRLAIGLLLEKFGPLLLQLLITNLTPKEPS